MKTIKELLKKLNRKKPMWGIFTEEGQCLKKFRYKTTARDYIPKLRISKREKLEVVELTNER